jgi:hypothetical protein
MLHPLAWTSCTLFSKVHANLCRSLTIRHLVNRFHRNYASTAFFTLKTLCELGLCLTRTEYQDGVRIANTRDDLIIVSAEMGRKSSLSLVLCQDILWSISSFGT